MSVKVTTTVTVTRYSDTSGEPADVTRVYHDSAGHAYELDMTDREHMLTEKARKTYDAKVRKGKRVNPTTAEHTQFLAEAKLFAQLYGYNETSRANKAARDEYRFFLETDKLCDTSTSQVSIRNDRRERMGWPTRMQWRKARRTAGLI